MYDITYSIHVTSCPLYLWQRIHSVWQHKTVCFWYPTHHMCNIICMTSHANVTWHHTHCIRHCTHCIFVITSSPLTSYTLLYDTVPTICVTSYALYITSYQLLMSLHYLWYHSLYIWNHMQYVGPHTHYTCDITAPNRCHDSRSIDHITHTLYYITLG